MPSSACKTCALDRKSTRLNSSHTIISYAVFCLKKSADSEVGGLWERQYGKPTCLSTGGLKLRHPGCRGGKSSGDRATVFFLSAGDPLAPPLFPSEPLLR